MFKCKTQESTAISTFESEIMAISLATSALLWLVGLLRELSNYEIFCFKKVTPIPLLNDNIAAIFTCKENAIPTKAKHVIMRAHFIMEAVLKELLKVTHLSTNDNVPDIGTKPLGVDKFHQHASIMLGCPPLDPSQVGQDGLYY